MSGRPAKAVRPVSLEELLGAPSDALPEHADRVVGVAPLAAAELFAFPKRKCLGCGVVMAVSPASWQFVRGKPWGSICRVCKKGDRNERTRKRDRRVKEAVATATAKGPMGAAEPAVGHDRKMANMARATKVNMAKAGTDKAIREQIVEGALRQGVTLLARDAPAVVALVFGYALDGSSIHHEWAVKFVAERIMPKRIFEELGAKAAGVEGGLDGKVPTYIINVIQAAPMPALTLKSIDVTPEER